MEERVEINGVEYVRAGARPTGNRAVVVVDRGWIFAGDVTRENGRIYLTKAVWVFRWESIGFDPHKSGKHTYVIRQRPFMASSEYIRILDMDTLRVVPKPGEPEELQVVSADELAAGVGVF